MLQCVYDVEQLDIGAVTKKRVSVVLGCAFACLQGVAGCCRVLKCVCGVFAMFPQCGAVWCSMLQFAVVYCSVLQCAAVHCCVCVAMCVVRRRQRDKSLQCVCSVPPRVAVCMQRVAVCLHCGGAHCSVFLQYICNVVQRAIWCSAMQCISVYCSVVQCVECVAVWCSVSQCVIACCSVLHFVTVREVVWASRRVIRMLYTLCVTRSSRFFVTARIHARDMNSSNVQRDAIIRAT